MVALFLHDARLTKGLAESPVLFKLLDGGVGEKFFLKTLIFLCSLDDI